ncbi:AmmeMemoRadiSam system protein A [Patescibacteria group bacterium]|nr:AmmeMemoRadiSam system protein A [Patescibacteria group bacterium]MBU1663717.1 AmmeMemoRadiSam system protein A [Patescibacteria group bacterium]MBU1934270.1 AmmeMemoRadiSam system protein A [Patescibacteria group bacterium]MBU2007728.1 AmmeMemoRadiSam system protein A [Patescibacteria group bacterium]MBU2233581.1 AmmeMemoRadiSam system protein A [Patescibacteria group bacterium]
MENKDKLNLLNLAREAIKSKLENSIFKVDTTKISNALKQKRGTFVTLKNNGKLRGCIGHLVAAQALCDDVIENARAAAFLDPRFAPLTKSEFEKIDIEISVLSSSKKLKYESLHSLIKNLKRNKPGVILKHNGRMATFLPQVWNELPNAKQFLSNLCLKAGLDPDEWTREVEIETYTVEKISSD